MDKFVLAITTYNRVSYLKECLDSWFNTKCNDVCWKLIIADDGSTDSTVKFIQDLKLEDVEIIKVFNSRIGVHQQTNQIFNHLTKVEFDICFKIDDDVRFLKKGWDLKYSDAIKSFGYEHLVFYDNNWSLEQTLSKPLVHKGLIGNTNSLNVQGSFFTVTRNIIASVGYFDVESFGFRGMGHVDYTHRCAKANFTDKNTPWDIINSNEYLTCLKKDYKGSLNNTEIASYDHYTRESKERIVLNDSRVFIPFQPINVQLFEEFQRKAKAGMISKIEQFEKEKKEIINWFQKEYNHIPKWVVKISKLLKLLKTKKDV